MVAGVCAGLARYTDTDPLLWRIGTAVLTVFGGTGIALYVLGWLLIPRLGQGPTAVERALRRPDANVGTVVLLAVGAVVLLSVVDNGPGFGALLLAGAVAYLIFRERGDKGPGEAPGTYSPQPYATAGAGARTGADASATPAASDPYDSGLSGGLGTGSYDTSPFAAWDAGGPAAAPDHGRSRLGLLTLSAAAVLAGVLLTLRSAGVEQVTVARTLAAVLVVLGAGMVVGTWVGRARWLLLPSLAVAAALVPAALLQAAPGSYDEGVGQRTWTPGPADDRTSFSLGLGQVRLDLRQLDPDALDGRPLQVDLGAGEVMVLVPEDLRVRVDGDVRLGDILVREVDGDVRRLTDGEGERVRRQFVVGDAGDPTVELDLAVAVGEIEVRRVAS